MHAKSLKLQQSFCFEWQVFTAQCKHIQNSELLLLLVIFSLRDFFHFLLSNEMLKCSDAFRANLDSRNMERKNVCKVPLLEAMALWQHLLVVLVTYNHTGQLSKACR